MPAPTFWSYCDSLFAACPLTHPNKAAPATRVMAITASVDINSETPLLFLKAFLCEPAPLRLTIRTVLT